MADIPEPARAEYAAADVMAERVLHADDAWLLASRQDIADVIHILSTVADAYVTLSRDIIGCLGGLIRNAQAAAEQLEAKWPTT